MKKIVVIVGQTSSGKSDLGINLAKFFNGEIVSADSRQVYCGLDFCSGKVTKEEMEIVPHHLIDCIKLNEQFTLFDFQKNAYKCIDEIIEKNKQPFVVGGTGLYTRSIVEGFNLSDAKIDKNLREELEKKSKEELLEICKCQKIEVPSEVTSRRLIRLIEENNSPKEKNEPRYEVLQIGIKWERKEIYERIEKRLKMRLDNMIKEIQKLLDNGAEKDFLMSLGLEAKYVLRFLDNEFDSKEDMFEELFKEERHFAKRQETWYRKEKNIVWLDAKDSLFENAKKLVAEFLSK